MSVYYDALDYTHCCRYNINTLWDIWRTKMFEIMNLYKILQDINEFILRYAKT